LSSFDSQEVSFDDRFGTGLVLVAVPTGGRDGVWGGWVRFAGRGRT
jgi:hypothetical protein